MPSSVIDWRRARGSLLALLLAALSATASAPAHAQPATLGRWSPVFDTQNVMIHASVLPNGKVLFWSRREATEGLNPHQCQPRLWDPAKGTGANAFSLTQNTPGYNLFCSGHAFLPDGRLLVAGGHLADTHGESHATIYDPQTNSWSAAGVVPVMNTGRWYPTATTLPDGSIVVMFGSDQTGNQSGKIQVFKDNAWRDLSNVTFNGAPYYPRLHVVGDGRVFMSGPLALTQFLDTSGTGNWTPLSNRINNFRDYAPSVMYRETPDDAGKILHIGGGNGPTKAAEVLDLNQATPTWKGVDDMHFPRRQHNATILPDGTVIVMGGTQGTHGNSKTAGFNDLTPGAPIRSADLWNPKTGHWTKLDKALVDRCYHSIALLLPDATVLSAGGGEYSPSEDGVTPNPPQDTHKDAQIFSPPYLFQADGSSAARPAITTAPADVSYGQAFAVGTAHPDQVGQVNWVSLGSVTHSFNMNQRFNKLKFAPGATSLSVTAPATANLCPPGHYMLFVLNKAGVPSVARIIRIHP
ncbi:MAG: DUF1929 domain-containing protein [Planctomycetia bacterium]|nr:DUF1929 domain-containing protein [Planctomycetia bacterium]